MTRIFRYLKFQSEKVNITLLFSADCLDVLLLSLDLAPVGKYQIPALFYLAETVLYWLQTEAAQQPYLRAAEMKLLKVRLLFFFVSYVRLWLLKFAFWFQFCTQTCISAVLVTSMHFHVICVLFLALILTGFCLCLFVVRKSEEIRIYFWAKMFKIAFAFLKSNFNLCFIFIPSQIGFVVFMRLYYHHMAGQLREQKDTRSRLALYLEGKELLI